MPEVKTLNYEQEIVALRARLKLADNLAMAARIVMNNWIIRDEEIGLERIDDIVAAYKRLDTAYKRYLGKVEL